MHHYPLTADAAYNRVTGICIVIYNASVLVSQCLQQSTLHTLEKEQGVKRSPTPSRLQREIYCSTFAIVLMLYLVTLHHLHSKLQAVTIG